ncbi:MAG: DMT family transporter [Alphaproteobacteria bacterium]
MNSSLVNITNIIFKTFRNKNNLIGIFWNLIKCLAFSLVSILSKILSDDLHVFQIFFIAMCIRVLIFLPVLFSKKTINLSIHNYKFYFIRSILTTCGLILWFYTLSITPINEATIVSYTAPLFTILLAHLILKENLSIKYLTVTLLGFLGTIIAVHAKFSSFNSGFLLAFITTIIWALTNIVSKIQATNEGIYSQMFYNTILMAIFSMPFAIQYWQPLNFSNFSLLFLIALFFLVNNISLTLSFKYGDLVIVSPFEFSRLIFSYILAYFYFNETMDIYKILGSIVILITSIYLIRLETKKIV